MVEWDHMADKWIIKPTLENTPDLSARDGIFIENEVGDISKSELLELLSEWLSYGSELKDVKRFTCTSKCFIRFSKNAEDHSDADWF